MHADTYLWSFIRTFDHFNLLQRDVYFAFNRRLELTQVYGYTANLFTVIFKQENKFLLSDSFPGRGGLSKMGMFSSKREGRQRLWEKLLP